MLVNFMHDRLACHQMGWGKEEGGGVGSAEGQLERGIGERKSTLNTKIPC